MISHDGPDSPDTISPVDQTVNGGQWNLLGTYSYTVGSTGTVVLDNDFTTGNIVVADAIKWEEVGDPSNAAIVDNVDATFEGDANEWSTSTNPDPNPYGQDVRYIPAYSPFVEVPNSSVNLVNSVGGWTQYGSGWVGANHVCWACHHDDPAQYRRPPKLWPKVFNTPGAVPDTVLNDGTGVSLIAVSIGDPDGNESSVVANLSSIGANSNQTLCDDGSHGDEISGDDVYSYLFTVPAGKVDTFYSFKITATDHDGNTGAGRVGLFVAEPDAIYVDNVDAVFAPDCSDSCDPNIEWSYSDNLQEDFAADVRWKFAGDGSATARWTPVVPETGDYAVYAWWTATDVRATDAPYTINYDGGSVTINVNQKLNGGQWNQLATVPFAEGTSGTIVLTDDADGLVIADAIKLVPVP
jgi:hypothetical protein